MNSNPDVKIAQRARRCSASKFSGEPCFAPALRGHDHCRFHTPRVPKDYALPLVEDAASIQLALNQVLRALQDQALDTKTCALMLYALQTAATNLHNFDLEAEQNERREQYWESEIKRADYWARVRGYEAVGSAVATSEKATAQEDTERNNEDEKHETISPTLDLKACAEDMAEAPDFSRVNRPLKIIRALAPASAKARRIKGPAFHPCLNGKAPGDESALPSIPLQQNMI